jgi:hypothetical protein
MPQRYASSNADEVSLMRMLDDRRACLERVGSGRDRRLPGLAIVPHRRDRTAARHVDRVSPRRHKAPLRIGWGFTSPVALWNFIVVQNTAHVPRAV